MPISYTEKQMSDAIEPLKSKIYELERTLASSEKRANDLKVKVLALK